MESADVVVIGGGIAGASAAWVLSEQRGVVVLETEENAGVHSTGRSAALLTETTGPAPIRALVRASRAFLEDPPEGFVDHGLCRPRGLLWVADDDEAAATLRSTAGPMEVLDAAEARQLVPALRADAVALAAYEPEAMDLDVDALLHGYLRGLQARGGRILTGEPARDMRRTARGWTVETPLRRITADVIVDAAGAWADAVAVTAGVKPLALRPLRRTAFTFTAPAGFAVEHWPMVVDAAERFYVKPDAGRMLGSPADETPTDPCDARAEELDVALAVERIEAAFDFEVRGVRSPWAGLRTFTADRVPVVGPDPDVPSFVWCAGQGGYGIKTSPGMATAVAHHVLGTPWPADLEASGVTPDDLAPARLRELR